MSVCYVFTITWSVEPSVMLSKPSSFWEVDTMWYYLVEIALDITFDIKSYLKS